MVVMLSIGFPEEIQRCGRQMLVLLLRNLMIMVYFFNLVNINSIIK